jgi:phosphonate transport system substrate-binding protein
VLRTPAFLLGLLLLVGCAPSPTALDEEVPDEEEERLLAIVRGQRALSDAGITELTWGLIPYVDQEIMKDRHRPIVEHVQRRLGIPITIVVGDDYADMEDKVVNGSVDLANLTPFSYVQAQARAPGIHVFASHVSDGSPSYGCYVIVRDDDPARTLADLKGRTFGFVDRSSASGWLVPAARMLDDGLHPLKDLRSTFLGGHDRVFDALVDGQIDAGATYAGALIESRLRRPNAVPVRVLAKGDRMPHDAYVSREGFPIAAARAVAAALSQISTGSALGRRTLATTPQLNGFQPVDDRHYDRVRRVEARVAGALEE